MTACEGALWKKGTFMAAYTGNIQEAVETVLETDQVAAVVAHVYGHDASVRGHRHRTAESSQ